ncbi:MAG TPA: Stk1 family PASTA domain-containing Ser/Thr kinase [Acidimicrobiales bacterium]|nr:Stk1 family PASTA domain-containing Ser/Thr kinase [Acidimicrobiales bacterium]
MEERVLGGRYRLVRHLARGGMAEVYVAEDQLLNRTVAVKVLFPELAHDEAFVERFRREARAAASLNHHNIVSVYDFGEDEGSWFIVMEYVEGRNLRDVIRSEGPMDPSRAAELGAEVAAALAAAHAQGIIHRDVKPANVLIAADAGTVKVADFGIARAAGARQGLTMPGTVLGTATYLSPEQAQGAEVDFRTDVYSLGMVLYEMLAGKPPFTGDSPVAVAYQQLSQTAPPPSTHNADVPPALDAIVMRAMAKNPDERQATAEEIREELLTIERAVGGPDATAFIAPPPAPDATAVIAGGSTSVLPPPAVDPEPPVTRRPAGVVSDDVYRRRRAAVIAGLALAALAVIALLVLLGGDDDKGTVTVPNVVGQPQADATRILTDAGLKVQVTQRDSPVATDQVSDQDPDAGQVVSRDATVTIFVARPTPTTTAPSTTRAPATSAPTTRETTATTAPATTQGTTATTQAPATPAAPTTAAPTTSIFVPTTVVTTTRP